MFQFLIGTIKTPDQSACSEALQMFQFLIGTIKTRTKRIAGQNPQPGFQFLIGTIKTIEPLVHLLKHRRFQFLIGTIKTGYFPSRNLCTGRRFNSS